MLFQTIRKEFAEQQSNYENERLYERQERVSGGQEGSNNLFEYIEEQQLGVEINGSEKGGMSPKSNSSNTEEKKMRYEQNLNKEDNLDKIRELIETTIKKKSQGSSVSQDILLNVHQTLQECGQLDREDYQQRMVLEEAKSALIIAQTIKETLPNYPIQNTICMLSRQIQRIRQQSTINRSMKHQPKIPTTIKVQQKSSAVLHPYSHSYQPSRTQELPRKVAPQRRIQSHPQSRINPKMLPQSSLRVVDKARSTKKYGSEKQAQRQQMQRRIAYVFIAKGYGMTWAKEYVRDLDGNKYNSLMTSVVKAALRKLIQILTKNMTQKVKPFDLNAQKVLRSPMVNCRKWLSRSQLHTFFKIINVVYTMNQEPIYHDEVKALYEKLIKQLNKRTEVSSERETKKRVATVTNGHAKQGKGTQPPLNHLVNQLAQKKANGQRVNDPTQYRPTESSHKQIPPNGHIRGVPQSLHSPAQNTNNQTPNPFAAYERQIAQLYVSYKNEDTVFMIISKKYRNISMDKNQLIKTIHRLIRIGLRKVLKYRKDYMTNNNLMPQINLNQSIVNKILNHPLGLQVKQAMIQCLMQKQLTPNRTFQLATLLNVCIRELSLQS